MQLGVTTAAVAAMTAFSCLSYAQPAHVQAPDYGTPPGNIEITHMIEKPRLPIEFAMNLKYILDHNLLLRDDFYSEANLKNVFNLNEVSIVDENRNILIAGNDFSGVFPRKKASALFGGSAASASLVGGKSRPGGSGSMKAALNFGMDKGGPDFFQTQRIFGTEFVRLAPAFSPHGGPPPATAIHGNEDWRYGLTQEKINKIVTIGFNPAGELSNIIIEINNATSDNK